jgi:hypothetical protein
MVQVCSHTAMVGVLQIILYGCPLPPQSRGAYRLVVDILGDPKRTFKFRGFRPVRMRYRCSDSFVIVF